MSEQEQYLCMGCGVKVQTENPAELGYAPSSALEKEEYYLSAMFSTKTL